MLLFIAPSVGANSGNLVVNGGFEQPAVETSQLWDIFLSGSSGLGWTIEWESSVPSSFGGYSRPDPAFLELQHGVNGWLPQEGEQYAELDTDWDGPGGSLNNEPASVRIWQDLPTEPGAQYELKFYFSPRPGAGDEENILKVKWNGTVIDTISRSGVGNSNTDWAEYTYTLTATDYTTRLEFSDGGIANSLGTFLDNVSVVEVKPAPTHWAEGRGCLKQPREEDENGNCCYWGRFNFLRECQSFCQRDRECCGGGCWGIWRCKEATLKVYEESGEITLEIPDLGFSGTWQIVKHLSLKNKDIYWGKDNGNWIIVWVNHKNGKVRAVGNNVYFRGNLVP